MLAWEWIYSDVDDSIGGLSLGAVIPLHGGTCRCQPPSKLSDVCTSLRRPASSGAVPCIGWRKHATILAVRLCRGGGG